MKIILCGMPCSGKSIIGKAVANKLGHIFIDTDELISSAYFKLNGLHATCREIYLKEGEVYFRDLESQVLTRLERDKNSVLATGGGILCRQENIQVLKNLGLMFYLKIPSVILYKRLINKPHLSSILDEGDIEESFKRMLEQRIPIYEKYCDFAVDAAAANVLDVVIKYASEGHCHGK